MGREYATQMLQTKSYLLAIVAPISKVVRDLFQTF